MNFMQVLIKRSEIYQLSLKSQINEVSTPE